MKRSKTKNVITKKVTSSPARMRSLTIVGLVAGLILGLGIAAYAANTMLHGHVRVNRTIDKTPSNTGVSGEITQAKSAPSPAASNPKPAPELIGRYGKAATSPLVAAAITKVESGPTGKVSQDARLAADRYEALAHGYWRPGTDPMAAVMAGYVPPGMPPEQAAMLYRTLPHTPMMPQPMTPERVAAMAGEPADPMGFSQSQIQAQNDQFIRSTMRERFGPVYLPPLHRDHNRAPEAQMPMPAVAQGNPIQNHQSSIREMTDEYGNIQAQYAYDPYGQVTKLQGSLDSDFQYAGYYVHQPSGLLLTQARAYSPVLGRFISRDPMGEIGGTNLYAYVDNNPIGHRDPSGLAQWYGNWGGAQWTNGTDTWSESGSNFPYLPGQTGYQPPTDPRDACYFCHDVCLHNASTIQNTPNRQQCRGNCDTKLANCLRNARNSTGGQYGDTTGEETLFSGRINQWLFQSPYRQSIIFYPTPGGLCGN